LKVAFRVDASIDIGTGHVMRCLTLAAELRDRGAECHFICRAHLGNLLSTVRAQSNQVHCLPLESHASHSIAYEDNSSVYSTWLGCDSSRDATETCKILSKIEPDWLVVDHYSLSSEWEYAVRDQAAKLMVIDDLANREHYCDLLLDQNLGRTADDYSSLVPYTCRVLTGPKFALLRPEFSALRDYSLKRRNNGALSNLLISMGGVDKDNATGAILEALSSCRLPRDLKITVVMGQHAPWFDGVMQQGQAMQCSTMVFKGIDDMAQKMADSDLAIGAAGATSWERCCLGLPTLITVLADNQQAAARNLCSEGAALLIPLDDTLSITLQNYLLDIDAEKSRLSTMSEKSSQVTTGNGCKIITSAMVK
jgi:UDP-2,4-diacetamido-2,4,6-trideoxy-beta-L-altropyranose hydrolase